MASFFSNQEIANLLPMPTADSPLDIGMNKGAEYVPQAAQPVSRKPMPASATTAAPTAVGNPYANVPFETMTIHGDAGAGLEAAMQPSTNFMSQLGSAIGQGAGLVGKGIGALAMPLEMIASPISTVLEGLGGSSLGKMGGDFARGYDNYRHGGFGLTPGPNQYQGMPSGQMDPAAIQAEIDRLQQMLLQSGG